MIDKIYGIFYNMINDSKYKTKKKNMETIKLVRKVGVNIFVDYIRIGHIQSVSIQIPINMTEFYPPEEMEKDAEFIVDIKMIDNEFRIYVLTEKDAGRLAAAFAWGADYSDDYSYEWHVIDGKIGLMAGYTAGSQSKVKRKKTS